MKSQIVLLEYACKIQGKSSDYGQNYDAITLSLAIKNPSFPDG